MYWGEYTKMHALWNSNITDIEVRDCVGAMHSECKPDSDVPCLLALLFRLRESPMDAFQKSFVKPEYFIPYVLRGDKHRTVSKGDYLYMPW